MILIAYSYGGGIYRSMKNETHKLLICNTTLSVSLKIPAIWYTYPKEKGGVSLFQGGLLFQLKRNQSEETNELGS